MASTTEQHKHTKVTETFVSKDIYEVLKFIKLYGYSQEVDSFVKTYLVNKEKMSQEITFVVNELIDFDFESPVSSKYSYIQERVIYLGKMDEIIDSIKAYINL